MCRFTCILGLVLTTLHALFHSMFTVALQVGLYSSPHFQIQKSGCGIYATFIVSGRTTVGTHVCLNPVCLHLITIEH